MRATTSCSVQFDTAYGEYALLDEAGELLEAGKLRMTKAALWNRFAALSPSVISVNYDPRFLWAVEMLTQQGHAVVFSGAVPEIMRHELAPVVGNVKGTALLCPSSKTSSAQAAATGIFFLVDSDGQAIVDAHYMVGPVTAQTQLSSLAQTIPQSVQAESAQESASRLHQLVSTGMMNLPEVPIYALKGNAVAAA